MTQSRQCRKPWVNEDILQKIKHKNRLYKKFITSKDPNVLKEFKRLRNQIVNIIRKAKNSYYNNLFSQDIKRSDLTWKKINSVLSYSRNCQKITAITY